MSTQDENRLPDDLVQRLSAVRSVGIITGAGVSAESGIPTYRGKGGIYDDPEEGERTVEALSGPALLADPDRTWRAVADLARASAHARPNAGHEAIAAIEEIVDRFVLLTQNVDGLHQLAGSKNVIDIHGNVFATRCMSCGETGLLNRETLPTLDRAPHCHRCQGVLRPDAVLFEEMLPVDKVQRMDLELRLDVPDLVVVAGTSAIFPYIGQPVWFAKEAGKLTVEVNPEPTLLSGIVDYALRGPSGRYLPLIRDALAGSNP
jgi:NAD-dependent deacetylase